jgi:hypothetical protein
MQTATSAVNSSSPLPKVIFVVVLLVALYYLYNFLTDTSGLLGMNVLKTVSTSSPGSPYVTKSDGLPAVYEGGELSINTWVYINDYATRKGYNKHLLSFGGDNFLTCLLYFGPYKNSLSVRVQTKPSDELGSSVDLKTDTVKKLFNSAVTETSLIDPNTPCDISTVDMQRWVQITLALNNKTCDVYIDGKLSRSCILPSFYKVDKINTKLTLCETQGFGGFISNTSMYNYALNPEQIWKLYMTGPGPQYSLWEYITSLFTPASALALDYPKKNITP